MEFIVAGEEAPLRIHGAACKNICDQVAGVALLLQGMVELIAADIHPRYIILGEINVGLPHQSNDMDPLVLRDVRVLVGVQQLHRLGFMVAGGRHFHKIADTVEKWVEKTVGDIVLRGAPAVELLVVFHRVIELLV